MPGAERWPVVAFTPTAHPLEELLTGFAKALDGDLGVTVRQLRDRPEILLEAVRRTVDDGACADGGRRPPPVRPVLLVDQFEELFTLCSDEDERRAFVRVLCAVSTSRRPSDPADVSGRDPAVVVLGVRADLSGRCVELPELATVFTDGLFVLPPMSVAGLREAITRPAQLAGLTLEPGLVPVLLRDSRPARRTGRVARRRIGRRARPAGRHSLGCAAADLPRAADHLAAARGRHPDGRGVRAHRRYPGAVARTAEDVFAGLYPAEQQTIRRILVRLVHVADGTGPARCRMSRAALMERLADTDGATAALDAFVRARLITADRHTVEIAHEALLHAWPRLRGWIDADRHGLLIHQQLAHAAEEWEREGGDPSALYRGTRLDTVRAWAEERDGRSRLQRAGGGVPAREPGRGGRPAAAGQAAGPAPAGHAGHAGRAAGPRRGRRSAGVPAALGRAAAGAGRPFPGTRRAVRLAGRRSARGLDAARRGGLPLPGDARGARRPAEHTGAALLGPARWASRAGQLGGVRARRAHARDGQFGRHGDPATTRGPPYDRHVHDVRAGAVGRLQPRRTYARGRCHGRAGAAVGRGRPSYEGGVAGPTPWAPGPWPSTPGAAPWPSRRATARSRCGTRTGGAVSRPSPVMSGRSTRWRTPRTAGRSRRPKPTGPSGCGTRCATGPRACWKGTATRCTAWRSRRTDGAWPAGERTGPYGCGTWHGTGRPRS